MSNSEKETLKERMIHSLVDSFGLREATNITSYYFDAKSDISQETVDKDTKLILSGYPVQYVTKVSFFYGHKFHLDKSVLIPRPETEELVHWIITELKSRDTKLKILDIGSGSGCIILSVMKALDSCEGTAIDINPNALELINKNATTFDIELNTFESDILQDNSWKHFGQFDVIVCNPPYIHPVEKDRMSPSVLEHEPQDALFVTDKDPLQFYRRLLDKSFDHLSEGGCLYFETSHLYHDELNELVESTGKKFQFKKDMQGNWRMLKVEN